ncbi:hypothetical protein E2C01_048330 [Portunus trituberculatus]|uniref:Uncharacterized protein n=1 Tax=Portunus trituberculatus TaxID=210409 RepID=A0A5B7GD18_PORTR|nr:hypothetical protein [Portunus trituberculatus]
MDLSLTNSGLGRKWEGTGCLAKWMMNGTEPVIMSLKILDEFMDGDDRWN